MKDQWIEGYLQKVAACLTCGKGKKNARLRGLRRDLEEQLADRPVSSYEELVSLVGSPEAVAEDLSTVSERTTHVKSQKQTVWILGIILVALLIVCIAAIGIAVWYSGHHEVETLIIDYTSSSPQ